jgi:ABC-2 type transport system ATP-binding protein
VISVQNVSKHFYSLVAVDGVSFTVPPGEVLGIVGPNGAGKTTLFRVIAGFLQPDGGSVRPLNGEWPAIGYKPEQLLFPNQMRVAAYLALVARLCRLDSRTIGDAVRSALEQVKLENAAQKRIGECSKGMRQRLALAQCLMGRPPLIILDEPSSGLDPEGQVDICEIIRELNQAGHTILMSSHQLAEVTSVCTRLIILNHGRIHYEGDMEAALALRPHVTIEADRDLSTVAGLLKSLHPDIDVAGSSVILNNEAIQMRRHVLSLLVGIGFDVVRVRQKRTTLEEIYAEAVR